MFSFPPLRNSPVIIGLGFILLSMSPIARLKTVIILLFIWVLGPLKCFKPPVYFFLISNWYLLHMDL